MSVEVTGEDLAAADAVMESVEWQMSNFMPAKGEGGEACRSRRLHAAIAEAVRDARHQAGEAMRERCAAYMDERAERLFAESANKSTGNMMRMVYQAEAAAIRSIDTRGE